MAATQEVVLRIKGDSKDAQNALSSVSKALNSIDSSKASKEFSRASKSAEEHSSRSRRALSTLGHSVERVGDSVARLGVNLASLGLKAGAAGVGALIASLGGIGLLAVDAAAKWEEYGVILGNVLAGGEAQAKQMLSWLGDFAKQTPYELDEVVQAAVKLSAYGIDATQVLQTLGDTAASMGKPLNEAVEALADAQTGEFERLKEFGLKALDMGNLSAEQLAKIPAEIQATGDTAIMYTDKMGQEQIAVVDRNSREMVTSTLTGIWNSRYQGGMEKLSKTWKGVWSNIKDGVSANLRSIGQIFLPHLTEWGTKLTTWMANTLNPAIQIESTRLADIWAGPGSFQEKLQLGWDTFDDFLVDLGVSKETADDVKAKFEVIGIAVKDVATFVKDLATTITEHWNTVKPLLEGLVALWIAVKIQAGLAAVAQAGAWLMGGKGFGGAGPTPGGPGGGGPIPVPAGGKGYNLPTQPGPNQIPKTTTWTPPGSLAGPAAGSAASAGLLATIAPWAAAGSVVAGLGLGAYGISQGVPHAETGGAAGDVFGVAEAAQLEAEQRMWEDLKKIRADNQAKMKVILPKLDVVGWNKSLETWRSDTFKKADEMKVPALAAGKNYQNGIASCAVGIAGKWKDIVDTARGNTEKEGPKFGLAGRMLGLHHAEGVGATEGENKSKMDSILNVLSVAHVPYLSNFAAGAHSLMESFGGGMDSKRDWLKGIVEGILGFVKGFFGGSLPEWGPLAHGTSMYLGGQALVEQFGKGLHIGSAFVMDILNSITARFAGAMGGLGVAQWADEVMMALMLTGYPLSWAPGILARMNQESGGNPFAINNWDSNAAAGDPSRGLMQTIGSTFNAYHQPGTSFDIYDPLANIAAAINYIASRYGSPYNLPAGGYRVGGISLTPSLAAVSEDGEPEIHLTKRNVREFFGAGTGDTYAVDKLIVVSNDPDDMFAQLRSKLGRGASDARTTILTAGSF